MEANTKDNAVQRGTRRVLQGTVIGNGMDKTISVRVERTFKHPKYKKYIRRHEKYMAHDEANTANVGDTVRLVECRPLSKTKRWRMSEIVGQAVLPEEAQNENIGADVTGGGES
ncbi:MAG: small subunit ribosomal protein S17 [Candidatus Paceibacteria bacterium]|jgi:small subunit ribosomal protein S17